MSRTSSEGSGTAEPGVRTPLGRHAMGFLKWLDGFLSEALRRAPPEELGRARVVAGATVAVILLGIIACGIAVTAGLPWGYFMGSGSSLVGYIATLWGLRRATSTRLPALLLSGIMASGVLLTSLLERDPYLSANAGLMFITILTVYLLGPRLGLVILIPVVVIVGGVSPLWAQVVGGNPRVFTPVHEWSMSLVAAMCLVAGWAVGWLYSAAHAATHAALERDIKARKEAEAKLGELHRTLLEVSRQAGMTEIASGVLHNVGNTLNSLNISVGILTDRLRGSRLSRLVQASELLNDHAADLASFFATDPRGTKLPAYLSALSVELMAEREEILREMRALGESVEHIKSIVVMQQKHARYGGVVEQVTVPQLINDALRLDAGSFEQLGIDVRREYAEVPPIMVDRHKLLQILINLLSNARHALMDSDTRDKRVTIRVGLAVGGERLRIEVADNGMGIALENLTRMFSQGFTTKKSGHGFGLHISALAAAELKGRLSVTSAGPGQGATFTVEVPVQGGEAAPTPPA